MQPVRLGYLLTLSFDLAPPAFRQRTNIENAGSDDHVERGGGRAGAKRSVPAGEGWTLCSHQPRRDGPVDTKPYGPRRHPTSAHGRVLRAAVIGRVDHCGRD